MNRMIQLKQTTPIFLIALVTVSLGLSPTGQAVVPPPDGGYPGFNTAEGQNALFSLTTGAGNTAVGWSSLFSATGGSFNTALGAGALVLNTEDENTATGAGALLSNTTGRVNTANGAFALFNNTEGVSNTASGHHALFSNTSGNANTATGRGALGDNTTGLGNTATGYLALGSDTSGDGNTAVGSLAGYDITGHGNVCIGAEVRGDAGVNDTTWIRNVYDSVAVTRSVYVNQDNKIGTLASTRRVKDNIEPMDKASETIFALKPVRFRYKKEIDRFRAPQFGLVAEDVAKVNPDLVTQDENGEPETVRYDAINAMLLNEFLKENRKMEQLKKDFESKIAEQQTQIEALTVGLQKVSAQIELNKPAPQTVSDNR
jgi:trimeric autotransporter adhesin